MNINEITLNEDILPNVNSKTLSKSLKKVDIEDFENNFTKDSKISKNHIIIIKKKRNRDSTLEKKSNLENNFNFPNNPKRKIEEIQQIKIPISSIYTNSQTQQNFPSNKYQENFEKYNFSFNTNTENFISQNSEELNPKDSNNKKSNVFSKRKIILESENLFFKNLNSNYSNFTLQNSLKIPYEESEIFKNYFPAILNNQTIQAIKIKDNLDLFIQEEIKINEIKKMNILQKRNLLTKNLIYSDFKYLKNKYNNIFGENYSNQTKVINNDECMIIHVDEEVQANHKNFENFFSEIKNDNNFSSYDLRIYEIISGENKFNFDKNLDKNILQKISEFDEENNLFYEKEKINQNESDIELKQGEYDNDSNREDNPDNEYPDEDNSNSDDDYDNYADIYNKKYYKNNTNSYMNKIQKMEKLMNEKFNQINISGKNKIGKSYSHNDSESDEYSDY